MLVKFWDLDTRHCFKTLVSHRSEVNDLIILNEDTRLLTGCHDNELRVFELTYKDVEKDDQQLNGHENNLAVKKVKSSQEEDDLEENEDGSLSTLSILDCKLIGSLIRESKDPLSQLSVDNTLNLFSSHSANEKHVEIYKINTQEEIQKRLAKKLKKSKRKLAKNDTEKEVNDDLNEDLAIEQTVNDEFTRICMIKSKHKIKFVDLYTTYDNSAQNNKKENADEQILFECKAACLLQNNQIEVYSFEVNKQINSIKEPTLLYTIENPGHRTDVRTLAFSSDGSNFLSASGDSMKIWNRMSLNCIRTFKCDYALCSLFLSDDNHVLIGKIFVSFY
jgi:U3 small nucleolar RNA-associated protein 12